ncbi:Inner membrane protein yhjX [uncultured Roseburia sp.]|uniref:MFS transporter n=1 Tax=Brotonthovivens ammoniilytica TaxID=2981725 RepID=A0ABT2TG41_9FIRM|nr:MFS transporter [Brotonthovivens ammoniilytica]MCU6760856.1 MFS transporter [Brotonthovivens ammoniilytica]SCI11338.1 Inner membrane protein yhjX [uncultured Roseburia sp.]
MKNRNRWFYAVIGVIVLLLVGVNYAWSVLSVPIAQEFTEWTKAQLSMTFTITMMMFCAGGLIAGFLNRKIKGRYLLWISAILLLCGFLITSNMQTLSMLYLGFGILSGLAGGVAYNTVMSTVSVWFPDKQGMISGILLMGFGLSSFIIGKIYTAFTSTETGAWRNSFRILAILIFVIVMIGGIFLVKPGKDFVPPTLRENGEKVREPASDVATGVMIKKKAFWMYYIWAIMVSAAGLALIAQASGIAQQAGPKVSAAVIATTVGLISVFNGIGRVIFGTLFDKVGYRMTMLLDMIIFVLAALILLAALANDNFKLIIMGFVVGGLAYGAVTPVNSAIISDFFGRTHYAVNLPMINTNLLFASFASAIAGKLYDTSGSYFSTIIMMISVVVVGFAAFLGIRRPAES